MEVGDLSNACVNASGDGAAFEAAVVAPAIVAELIVLTNPNGIEGLQFVAEVGDVRAAVTGEVDGRRVEHNGRGERKRGGGRGSVASARLNRGVHRMQVRVGWREWNVGRCRRNVGRGVVI